MSSKNPTITITFDRDKDTHSLVVEGVSGREMIIAVQSLTRNVEEKSGLPFDVCEAMGALEDLKRTLSESDEEQDRTTQDNG